MYVNRKPDFVKIYVRVLKYTKLIGIIVKCSDASVTSDSLFIVNKITSYIFLDATLFA